MNGRQVHFEAMKRWAAGMKLQEFFINPLLQIQANGFHVPDELPWRFLEGKKQAALATPTSGINDVCRQTRFAGSRCSRKKDGAATVKPLSAKHFVQGYNSCRNTLSAYFVLQAQ